MSLDEMFLPVRWNSSVQIRAEGVTGVCGFAVGAVVGMLYVETPAQAETFGVPLGSKLLDIEGPEGNKVTVKLEDVDLLEQ